MTPPRPNYGMAPGGIDVTAGVGYLGLDMSAVCITTTMTTAHQPCGSVV